MQNVTKQTNMYIYLKLYNYNSVGSLDEIIKPFAKTMIYKYTFMYFRKLKQAREQQGTDSTTS